MEKRNKYGNRTIDNAFGHFDSQDEWARFLFLQERAKRGEISDLRRQVEYQLLPAQKKAVEVKLKTKTKIVERTVERAVSYVADFVYQRNGQTVVEDVKGEEKTYFKNGKKKTFSTQTADFKIKKKLMLYFHQIEIVIVTSPTQWEEI